MPLSDFHGNETIVAALQGALRAARVPHALLFTGPRGLGKFTLARMFAQAANCERLTDDFCGECTTCRQIGLLANSESLIEQGLAHRGESADAATIERIPLILQPHPDVWALVPDPVRLRAPVARPMLRIGQIRSLQRAAYFAPQGRRRVFILDGADTMRWDVSGVFLKVLEEPPPTSTLILLAPSPSSLLLTIVSRCIQFHFAPLAASQVERILASRAGRKSADHALAAQLSEGSPGLALAMDVAAEQKLRRDALLILDTAARGASFTRLFSATGALAKNKEIPFEQQLAAFYTVLTDLLELTSGIRKPGLRNPALARELEELARSVNTPWVERAIAGIDQLASGARRNLNRQLGLDALAAALAAASPSAAAPTR
jgi:DNA polymerase III subunit delta'